MRLLVSSLQRLPTISSIVIEGSRYYNIFQKTCVEVEYRKKSKSVSFTDFWWGMRLKTFACARFSHNFCNAQYACYLILGNNHTPIPYPAFLFLSPSGAKRIDPGEPCLLNTLTSSTLPTHLKLAPAQCA